MSTNGTSTSSLWIMDRRHPEFGGVLWTLRRIISEHINRDFARWLASPERGRFIVCEYPFGATIEGVFAFFDDELELFSFVQRYFSPIPRDQRHLHLLVEQQVHSRFEELAATGRSPAAKDAE